MHDLNTKIANHLPAWQLAADNHEAMAAAVEARGARKTAGDVHSSVAAANQQTVDDERDGHLKAARRYSERVAAGQNGLVLHHGDDEEARTFNQGHQALLTAAGAAGRLKYIRPGDSFDTSGIDR